MTHFLSIAVVTPSNPLRSPLSQSDLRFAPENQLDHPTPPPSDQAVPSVPARSQLVLLVPLMFLLFLPQLVSHWRQYRHPLPIPVPPDRSTRQCSQGPSAIRVSAWWFPQPGVARLQAHWPFAVQNLRVLPSAFQLPLPLLLPAWPDPRAIERSVSRPLSPPPHTVPNLYWHYQARSASPTTVPPRLTLDPHSSDAAKSDLALRCSHCCIGSPQSLTPNQRARPNFGVVDMQLRFRSKISRANLDAALCLKRSHQDVAQPVTTRLLPSMNFAHDALTRSSGMPC